MEDISHLFKARLDERLRATARLTAAGVSITDPLTTYVDTGVEVGAGTVIHPNTTIMGGSSIGRDCEIGPNSIIRDSAIADGCKIIASVIEQSTLETGVDVGPFSHLRPGTHLEEGVHVGNFVEIKQARVGSGSKVGHFSYLGDAQVGRDVNIGAGAVTCNYDGEHKHETVIEDGVFIGSDTMLVARGAHRREGQYRRGFCRNAGRPGGIPGGRRAGTANTRCAPQEAS